MLFRVTSWLGASLLYSATIAAMYSCAPDRADAGWRWLSVGAVVATIVWLIATLGFGFYASRFGDYHATSGSLCAVVVLLLWLYVSAYAILLGGLGNAAAVGPTAPDPTQRPDEPRGKRGALVTSGGGRYGAERG